MPFPPCRVSCYGSDNRMPRERCPWWVSHVFQDLMETLPFPMLDFSAVQYQRFVLSWPCFISLLKSFISSLIFSSHWWRWAIYLQRWECTITQRSKQAVNPMVTSMNIYEAPFWESNTEEPSKPCLVSFFVSSQGCGPWRSCMWGWDLLPESQEGKSVLTLLQVVHGIVPST